VAEHACEAARLVLENYPSDRETAIAAFPDFQRFFAKRRLDERIAENSNFVGIRLSRNGMAFGFDGRHVRWWKKGLERMPRGGRSRAKINFLSQYQLALPFIDLTVVILPNRVVMYEPDKDFRLKRLWFGLPQSASENGRTEVYWLKPVPFELIAGFGIPSPTPEPDADEGDNLPLIVQVELEGDEIEEGEEELGV
jgi:hypothetical protein